MMGRPEFAHWCSQVCGYIRFKPDRGAVYEELMDHLRDSAQDLEQQGLEDRQAALQAVERMGDPETLGRQLDRSHNPWLGWLWVCSRWALGVALALALFSIFPLQERLALFYRPWSEQTWRADWSERLADFSPDCRAEYGGYFFSIPRVTVDCCVNRSEEPGMQGELWQGYELTLILRSWNPRFYLDEPYLSPYLSLEDSSGNRYDRQFDPDWPLLQRLDGRPLLWADEQKLRVYFNYGQFQALRDAQWLELVYQREGQGFSLRIPLEEGWLNENW